MVHGLDPTAVLTNPVDLMIGFISIAIIGAARIEPFRKYVMLIQVLLMLLRFYKHIGPMAKHYFSTHPDGKKLRPSTKIDNKINYLIKTHQLPYDNNSRHEELKKHGAAG